MNSKDNTYGERPGQAFSDNHPPEKAPKSEIEALKRKIEALKSEREALKSKIKALNEALDRDPSIPHKVGRNGQTVEILSNNAYQRELNKLSAEIANRGNRESDKNRPINITVIKLDINNMKRMNTAFGDLHYLADRYLLWEVMLDIAESLRPNDKLYHEHGDEYVIIARGINTASDLLAFLDRIAHKIQARNIQYRTDVAEAGHPEPKEYGLTFSAGVASLALEGGKSSKNKYDILGNGFSSPNDVSVGRLHETTTLANRLQAQAKASITPRGEESFAPIVYYLDNGQRISYANAFPLNTALDSQPPRRYLPLKKNHT